jgi:hypothetical protein
MELERRVPSSFFHVETAMPDLSSDRIAVAQLYSTLLGRAPDAAGMDFWVGALQSGGSLSGIAQAMLAAPESAVAYPAGQSAAAFVSTLYSTLLGRAPDAAGLQFWLGVLEAQGPAAQGWLASRFVETLAQPLGAAPPGMSAGDYQRALEDRALVANKAQAGVYFAVSLRGTDLSLARDMLARVTADPASIQQAIDLANGVVPVTPDPPVILPPVLTSAHSVLDIQTLLSGYAGNAATVIADGMGSAQLNAVASAIDKIKAGGITGILGLSAAVTAADMGALVGKYAGAELRFDAQHFDAPQWRVAASALALVPEAGITNGDLAYGMDGLDNTHRLSLLAHASDARFDAAGLHGPQIDTLLALRTHLATDGLYGTMVLDQYMSVDGLRTALSTPLGSAVTVQLDATSMSPALLQFLGDADQTVPIAITGELQLSGSLTAAQIETLLARMGNDFSVKIFANGMGEAQIVAALPALDKVVGGGIYGALRVAYATLDADSLGLLPSKLAPSATLSILGSAGDDVIDLTGFNRPWASVLPGGGGDRIVAGTALTIPLSGRDATRNAELSLADTNLDHVLRIDTTASLIFTFSIAEGAFGNGLTFLEGATYAGVSTWTMAVPGQFSSLQDVLDYANMRFLGNLAASSNDRPQFYSVELREAGAFTGSYMFLNDEDPALTLIDLVAVLGEGRGTVAYGFHAV